MTMNMECAVTAASKLCSSSTTEMPPELALHLFENGGFLIFTGVPQNTEFGIDYKSWTVGPNFCGLKMIPPGVHFIYFSVKNAPRIGFFHDFKEREVLIRKWDHSREDMMIDVMHTEEASKIRDNLKQMDRRLAPYPYENYRNWFALSNYIKGRSIERLRPENEYGRISGQAELMTMEDEVMERAHEAGDYSSSSRVDREHPNRLRFVDHEGLPIMRVRPGFEIRFQEIPAVVVSPDFLWRLIPV
ncbi:hypothetical protein AB6A40_007696 [Gnathostoma spinigerum]|uniref:Protein AAR2 homolog n=1 Tax=Gnathostoma spinigerum TaxID=75299 RepID=A0ABD6EWD5_9BILA